MKKIMVVLMMVIMSLLFSRIAAAETWEVTGLQVSVIGDAGKTYAVFSGNPEDMKWVTTSVLVQFCPSINKDGKLLQDKSCGLNKAFRAEILSNESVVRFQLDESWRDGQDAFSLKAPKDYWPHIPSDNICLRSNVVMEDGHAGAYFRVVPGAPAQQCGLGFRQSLTKPTTPAFIGGGEMNNPAPHQAQTAMWSEQPAVVDEETSCATCGVSEEEVNRLFAEAEGRFGEAIEKYDARIAKAQTTADKAQVTADAVRATANKNTQSIEKMLLALEGLVEEIKKGFSRIDDLEKGVTVNNRKIEDLSADTKKVQNDLELTDKIAKDALFKASETPWVLWVISILALFVAVIGYVMHEILIRRMEHNAVEQHVEN